MEYQVPAPLMAQRVISQQLTTMRKFVQTLQPLFEDPTPGSMAEADRDYVEAHAAEKLSGLRWWTQRACLLNLRAAEEHAKGMQRVLTSEELLPVPAMALARCSYDALMQTCWLLDSRILLEQRIARWAGRMVHDTQEPPTALASLGDVVATKEHADYASKTRTMAQELIASSGFELKMKQGDRSDDAASVSYRGHKSSLIPNLAHLAEIVSPVDQSLWVLFSGAVHNRGWFLSGLEGDGITLATSVLAPMLDACDDFVVEMAHYFDVDVMPSLKASHGRRIALLRQARPDSGPYPDPLKYREQRGLPPLRPSAPEKRR